jgi:molecular chaperone GrpE
MSSETENEELDEAEEIAPEERPEDEAVVDTGEPGGDAAEDSGGEDSGEESGLIPEEVTVEQVKELIEQAGKAQQFYDKWVRLTADFDNYKKRALRDKTESLKYANEALIEKLLPVLDNFDAALVAMNNDAAGSVDSLKMGVNMISKQLRDLLTDFGLSEVAALGQAFDHNLHEAVSQKATDEAPEGQVVEQLRKGYKLKDRLVRAASVVVAKAPGEEETEATDEGGEPESE